MLKQTMQRFPTDKSTKNPNKLFQESQTHIKPKQQQNATFQWVQWVTDQQKEIQKPLHKHNQVNQNARNLLFNTKAYSKAQRIKYKRQNIQKDSKLQQNFKITQHQSLFKDNPQSQLQLNNNKDQMNLKSLKQTKIIQIKSKKEGKDSPTYTNKKLQILDQQIVNHKAKQNNYLSVKDKKHQTKQQQLNKKDNLKVIPQKTEFTQNNLVIQQERQSQNSQYIKSKIPKQILRYIKNEVVRRKEKNFLQKQNLQFSQQLGSSNIINSPIKKRIRPCQTCEICQIKSPSEYFFNITSKCSHRFCSACLYSYIHYKILTFQKVLCPSSQCQHSLDIHIMFFLKMKKSLQDKYKKFLLYEKVINDQNLRICPSQQCNGTIYKNQGFICNQCKTEYCSKCYLPKHENNCQDKQLEVFKKLKYSKCPSCNVIFQKGNGCIHITCRCKYEFCYICKEKWKTGHRCPRPNITFRQKCKDQQIGMKRQLNDSSYIRSYLEKTESIQSLFNRRCYKIHSYLCLEEIDCCFQVVRNKFIRRFLFILIWIPMIIMFIPLVLIAAITIPILYILVYFIGCAILFTLDVFRDECQNTSTSYKAPLSACAFFLMFPVFFPFLFIAGIVKFSAKYFALKTYLTICNFIC